MKIRLTGNKTGVVLLVTIGVVLVMGAIAAVVQFASGGGTGDAPAIPGGRIGAVTAGKQTDKAPRRKSYPVGAWDIAVPYLNPFGSQDNYGAVALEANRYRELRYIGDDNMEAIRMIGGDVWQMQVDWNDPKVDAFDDLALYMAELGGGFYLGAQEDARIVQAQDKEGVEWWGVATRSGSGYSLSVYKEFKLRHDAGVSFVTADYDNREIFFLTRNVDHKYQSLKVELGGGEVQLSGKGVYEQGQYRRELTYNKTLQAFKAAEYALNDIPQDTSVPILWKITWNQSADPGKISVTLDEGEAIVPFRDGERLGALKVRGSRLGHIKVEASPGVVMTHPELNLKGDRTPDGDTLFWLPPGYWNVRAEQKGDTSYASSLNTRLVPVGAGEMTELDVSPLLGNAYRASEKGDASGGEQQLKLENMSAQGEQARVSFMLLDAENPGFAPDASDIEMTEGGRPGKIVKLERLQTPPSVVLALDSSGSMAGVMSQVLESARTFIQGLPDNAHIRVIDFDSDVRLLEGSGKDEVLESLKTVKAQGSTTLYDSVVQGLELLRDKERPTIVVFTDGVDSSTDNTGRGSRATRQEVEQAIRLSGIPLFAIGFGPEHEASTLLDMAAMSGGTYYSAQDTEALGHVFSSINDRLGNHYELTYERPKEQAPSDMPVVSLTLDVSGSMDVDPDSGNGDYRLDKVKRLYHDFIGQMPDNALMQLVSFSTEVHVQQIFTSRKAELLQSLGTLTAGGGTDIYNSAAMTYQSLKKIPSDRRVLVYLTDAALAVEDDKRAVFEELLAGMKEDGIQTLWVGLGTEESEEAFKWAAEKSGGKYVISEDPVVLADAFRELMATVQTIPAESIPLTLAVRSDSAGSGVRHYTDSRLADFPALPDSGDKVKLGAITYTSGSKVAQYEAQTAALLYGRDIPGEDVKIYKRMPLQAEDGNKAVEWKALELVLLKRLKGVDAPAGRSFAAVDMELTNTHADGASYQIPDFASHFFMNVNQSGSYPASTATWLAEAPLAPPGETGIAVKRDDTVRGMLVFIVPDETIEQASVHFYDTANGHMALPLVGAPAPGEEQLSLTALPTTAAGRLSDTFEMAVTAAAETPKIGKVELKRQNSLFKVLDAELQSKVQANMKLDPSQRFYLRAHTEAGPFMIPVHTATALLPYGFLRPVTLGPGSASKARLAFQLPAALRDAETELYIDLYGGATVLPVGGKGTGATEGNAGHTFEGGGAKLTVNALSRVTDIESSRGDYVVADITVTDVKDGNGVFGFRESFALVAPSAEPDSEAAAGQVQAGASVRHASPGRGTGTIALRPDAVTDALLLGMSSDWAVFDGTARRGLLVFSIPAGQGDASWTLQSSLFPGLKLPLGQEAYKEEGLLVKMVTPELDKQFDIRLSAALTEAISLHRMLQSASLAEGGPQAADLDTGGGAGLSVPAPLPVVHGISRLAKTSSMEQFEALMNGLAWLPSPDSYFQYRQSPEAVLTQGWGTEGDLAHLAGGLLARLGYGPKLRMVKVTEAGREALRKLGGLDEAMAEYLPAWAYTDEAGEPKLFVVPFMKDLSELSGLAFFPGAQEKRSMTAVQGHIEVYYKLKPLADGSVGGIGGEIADVFGGGAGEGGNAVTELRVLTASLDLDQLGKEALDIRAGGSGDLYTAVLESRTLQIVGNAAVDTSRHDIVGVRIAVQLPDGKLVHDTDLREGESVDGLFQTLAVNLPDLPAAAAEALEGAADREYRGASRPDDHSALAWYTRSILYRFVAGQTALESELAETLDVTAGRTGKERVIVATVRRDGSGDGNALRTSIDLQQTANRLHRATEESAQAFNLISGLFASRLEGTVLPGDKADFMDVWLQSPEDTRLFLSLQPNRQADAAYLKELGLPELLIARAEQSPKALLIPTGPTRIHGEERWAWLEIDPLTFETISVMDTGERGGFAEYLMQLERVSPTGDDYLAFMAGAFIGVSSSVWSVSSFALMLDDYEQIIKAAKLYTYGLGEVLGGMMDQKDLAKLEYSMSPLKLKMADADFDYLAKHFEKVKMGQKGDGSADIVGFALGFKSGAAHYFEQAEKQIAKKNK